MTTTLIEATSGRKLWTPGDSPSKEAIWRPGHAKEPGGVIVEAPFRASVLELVRTAIMRGEYVAPKVKDYFREDIDYRALALESERRKRLGIPLIAGGAAGAWTFTNTSRTNLLNGNVDIDTDSFKMALFLSTSDLGATENTYAGVTNEHANANGYTTGGIAVTLTLAGTTTVTVDIGTDPVWTASGGSIVARFAAIYEVSANILCYCLLDSAPADVTATNGNTLTVAAHASGVFTLA